MKPPNTIQPKIVLHNNHTVTPIQHLNPNQAHRTLGQYKAPDGNQSKHFDYMVTKSSKWLVAIKEARLSKQEAQAAYEAIWFPSLSYGLGTTNFSYKELNTIQIPIINHILPLLGYNRHLPRAVVFGSSKLGGLNLKHLYIDQGTKHITNLIKYYRNGGSIGQLLRISLRWIHLIAGFSFCPLAHPQLRYHHIGDPWYQTLIRFLYECDAYIETNETIQIYNSERDSSLMEDFLLQDPSATELKTLNACRIYLRVTTLSDICTARGDTLTRNCWEGTHPTNAIQLWPRQERPTTQSWSVWRKFISTCYLADETTCRKKRKDLRLDTPLGPWYKEYQPSHSWPYYINPFSLTIYSPDRNGIFLTYSPCRNTGTQLTYQPTGRTNYRPGSTIPIDCSLVRDRPFHLVVQKLDLPTHTIQRNNTTFETPTFNSYLATLQPWEQHLLRNLHLQCTLDTCSYITTYHHCI